MTRIVKVIGDVTLGTPEGATPTAPNPLLSGGLKNVFVENSPVVLIGDSFTPHAIGSAAAHDVTTKKGSTTVYINGALIYTANGALSCADTVSPGTSNVWVEGSVDIPL